LRRGRGKEMQLCRYEGGCITHIILKVYNCVLAVAQLVILYFLWSVKQRIFLKPAVIKLFLSTLKNSIITECSGKCNNCESANVSYTEI
uniref:Glycoprotein n=1 Tax=Brugia timori TaxID=42155 RepID=A0A0R3QN34_9BILA